MCSDHRLFVGGAELQGAARSDVGTEAEVPARTHARGLLQPVCATQEVRHSNLYTLLKRYGTPLNCQPTRLKQLKFTKVLACRTNLNETQCLGRPSSLQASLGGGDPLQEKSLFGMMLFDL